MPAFTPRNSRYDQAVRERFAAQAFMDYLGASLTRLEPGLAEISLPFNKALTQHDGFLHAGVLTALSDNACGFAALSLMPEGNTVLSVEFKVNLLAPAAGERFVARGQVLRAGRTITVCQGEVVSFQGEQSKPVATMLATMIAR